MGPFMKRVFLIICLLVFIYLAYIVGIMAWKIITILIGAAILLFAILIFWIAYNIGKASKRRLE
jgi:hypothetical protein